MVNPITIFNEPVQAHNELAKPYSIASSPPIFVDFMDDDLE